MSAPPRRSTRTAVVEKTKATDERAKVEKAKKSVKGAAKSAANNLTRRLMRFGSLGRRVNHGNNTMGTSTGRKKGKKAATVKNRNSPLIKPATFEYPPRLSFAMGVHEPSSGMTRSVARSLGKRAEAREKRVNTVRRRGLTAVRENANE